MRSFLVLISALIMSVTTLTACNSSSQADLLIYSGRTQDLIEPIVDRFKNETGLDVRVKYGTSTDLALTIDTEGARSPADVFFSQTPGAIGYVASKNLLQNLDQSLLENVDARYRGANGMWTGITGRIRVLAYNPDQVKAEQLPKTVFDLTKPEFKNKVAVAPTNASFQDFITAMREINGEDATMRWLKDMHSNGAQVYSNNSDIVQAIARQEITFGLVNHYYAYRLKAEDAGARVENYIFPNGDLGALLVSADAGILKGSKHTDAAKRFIDFLLKEDAQKYFANETFEYPLSAGVKPAANLPALESITTPSVDLDSLGTDLKKTEQVIEDSGIRRS